MNNKLFIVGILILILNSCQVVRFKNNSKNKFSDQNVISLPLKNARKVFEKHYLQSQISRFDGNISKTSKAVGMERSALHRKLKQLGITEEDKT